MTLPDVLFLLDWTLAHNLYPGNFRFRCPAQIISSPFFLSQPDLYFIDLFMLFNVPEFLTIRNYLIDFLYLTLPLSLSLSLSFPLSLSLSLSPSLPLFLSPSLPLSLSRSLPLSLSPSLPLSLSPSLTLSLSLSLSLSFSPSLSLSLSPSLPLSLSPSLPLSLSHSLTLSLSLSLSRSPCLSLFLSLSPSLPLSLSPSPPPSLSLSRSPCLSLSLSLPPSPPPPPLSLSLSLFTLDHLATKQLSYLNTTTDFPADLHFCWVLEMRCFFRKEREEIVLETKLKSGQLQANFKVQSGYRSIENVTFPTETGISHPPTEKNGDHLLHSHALKRHILGESYLSAQWSGYIELQNWRRAFLFLLEQKNAPSQLISFHKSKNIIVTRNAIRPFWKKTICYSFEIINWALKCNWRVHTRHG